MVKTVFNEEVKHLKIKPNLTIPEIKKLIQSEFDCSSANFSVNVVTDVIVPLQNAAQLDEENVELQIQQNNVSHNEDNEWVQIDEDFEMVDLNKQSPVMKQFQCSMSVSSQGSNEEIGLRLSELIPEVEAGKDGQLAKLFSLLQSIYVEDVDTFFSSILTGGPVSEAILNVIPEELNHAALSLIEKNEEFVEKSVPHVIKEGAENVKKFINATQRDIDNCMEIETQFLELLKLHLPLIFKLWGNPNAMDMSRSLSSSMFLERSNSAFDLTNNNKKKIKKQRTTPYDDSESSIDEKLNINDDDNVNVEEQITNNDELSDIDEQHPSSENYPQIVQISQPEYEFFQPRDGESPVQKKKIIVEQKKIEKKIPFENPDAEFKPKKTLIYERHCGYCDRFPLYNTVYKCCICSELILCDECQRCHDYNHPMIVLKCPPKEIPRSSLEGLTEFRVDCPKLTWKEFWTKLDLKTPTQKFAQRVGQNISHVFLGDFNSCLIAEPASKLAGFNQTLVKVWLVRNTGNRIWNKNVELRFIEGDSRLLFQKIFPVPQLKPGETKMIRIVMRAPNEEGIFTSEFAFFYNDQEFGEHLEALVIVDPYSSQLQDERNLQRLLEEQPESNEYQYDAELARIISMGFSNTEAIMAALDNQEGNVKGTLLILLREH